MLRGLYILLLTVKIEECGVVTLIVGSLNSKSISFSVSVVDWWSSATPVTSTVLMQGNLLIHWWRIENDKQIAFKFVLLGPAMQTIPTTVLKNVVCCTTKQIKFYMQNSCLRSI